MGVSVNLTHHFLIAMPTMADPHFANTLTYVCEHNPEGALGIVINKPIDMTLSALFGRGEGPKDMFISLGYAGWSAGQLEQELAQNAWLTVEADPAVLFDLPPEGRLPAAMRLLGIDFSRLSDDAGHA